MDAPDLRLSNNVSEERATSDPLLNTCLEEKFQIVELLHDGLTARVYKAKHLTLDQFVVVKILVQTLLPSAKAVRRFKNEAELLSKLKQANIVDFYAYGVSQSGQPFLVTEYLAGKTLEQILKEQKTLEMERAIPILLELCRALTYIHSQGIVHRDLKPANIMISNCDGLDTIKLLDFGIFKGLERDNLKLTDTDVILGTASYMSPEQCKGDLLDSRADIYSFGCLMYECLVGQPPLVGDNSIATMQNHLFVNLTSVGVKAAISADLERIILKCLEKSPEKRFQNAEELALALSKAKTKRQGLLPNSSMFRKAILVSWFIAILIATAYYVRIVLKTPTFLDGAFKLF